MLSLRIFWIPVLLGSLFAAEPVNLIPNGDFEKLNGEKLSDWLVLYGPSVVPPIATDAGFVRGKASAHLKTEHQVSTPGAKSVVLATEKKLMGVVAGAEYRLTFYAKSPVSGQPLDVYYYSAPDVKPHFYKLKSFLITGTWTKYQFVLKLPGEEEWQNRSLYIRLGIPYGEIFLDEVVLSENTSETPTQVAVVSTRKNLLMNPGFELDWLSWGPIGYRLPGVPYEEKEIPSAIDRTHKFEGASSLRIEPNGCVASTRYDLEIGKPYTFSFYARAEPASGPNRTVKFFVITPNWKILAKSLVVGQDLGGGWKRYALPVQIGEQGTAFKNTVYIRVDSQDNTVWMDAAQLEKGEMTSYEPGVQAGIFTKNEKGLFTGGKSEEVSVAVHAVGGLAKPLTVSLAARDVQENLVWKKDFSIPAGKEESLRIPLTLDNTALGVYEVKLTTAYPGETPLSVNTWRYAVIDRSKEVRQNPLFGSENVIGRTPAWLETWNENLANEAGSGFTRVFIWHGGGEDGADPVMLAQLKEQVLRKKNSGKLVMICINHVKEARLIPNKSFSSEPDEAMVAEEVEKFAAYAGKIAEHLKDAVDYYQLVNEPNIWNGMLAGGKSIRLMPPERYLRFITAGSTAIRARLPGAKIAANINGIDLIYTDKLFAGGAAKFIDAFTFHSYRMAPENPPVYDDIKRLRSLVDRHAKGMPLFNDEQYFGTRDRIATAGEDDRDYYSDGEEELTGRVLQNFLHHIASAQVPFALFSIGSTLYRFGVSSPVFYYHSFCGYRHMSQTLFDISSSRSIDVHPSLRTFLFERKDGVKIVSLNTRMYGVKGGVRNIQAESATDMNGNRIKVSDFPVDFLPRYLLFASGTSSDAVLTALKRGDFYGLDAPVRLAFDAGNGKWNVSVENCENRPLDAAVTFGKMPEGFEVPAPFVVKGLAAREIKNFSFSIADAEKELSWKKNYVIEYRAVVGDSFISKTAKLPSFLIPKKNGTPVLELGAENISTDFSGGKIPHHGVDDLSASFSLAWDDAAVTVLVQVKDNALVSGDGDEGRFWMNDSVQIYFDMQNDGGKSYDGNDAAYSIGLNKEGMGVAYLDKAPTGRYVGANNMDKGVDVDVKVSHRKTAQGYTVEIIFPKAALPYLDLKEGSLFGFSLLVNDNDGNGRKRGVTLGPKGTEPHGQPQIWKTVKLTGK